MPLHVPQHVTQLGGSNTNKVVVEAGVRPDPTAIQDLWEALTRDISWAIRKGIEIRPKLAPIWSYGTGSWGTCENGTCPFGAHIIRAGKTAAIRGWAPQRDTLDEIKMPVAIISKEFKLPHDWCEEVYHGVMHPDYVESPSARKFVQALLRYCAAAQADEDRKHGIAQRAQQRAAERGLTPEGRS